jgi:hypothetical protein
MHNALSMQQIVIADDNRPALKLRKHTFTGDLSMFIPEAVNASMMEVAIG